MLCCLFRNCGFSLAWEDKGFWFEITIHFIYKPICNTIWSLEAKVDISKLSYLLILSLSTQLHDTFGPNPIFLPYSVTKLYIFVLSIFLCICLFFTPYFCLYLNFTYADFGLHGPYHVTYINANTILVSIGILYQCQKLQCEMNTWIVGAEIFMMNFNAIELPLNVARSHTSMQKVNINIEYSPST